MSDSDRTVQLFLNSFSARDIAEPLASFDETTDPASVLQTMQQKKLKIVGLRRDGFLSKWLVLDDVGDGSKPLKGRSFKSNDVIPEISSLNTVVDRLSSSQYLFVRSFGQINGVICRDDLQKPAMRMWLFGLVTFSELRVTSLIDQYLPDGAWKQYLSEGRLQMAVRLQEERRRRRQDPSLLDCLQFGDKGQIVSRDPNLRKQTRFTSRRAVEEFVHALQDLRNNLAHSQDISPNWEVICDLASNLHRIVLGPQPD